MLGYISNRLSSFSLPHSLFFSLARTEEEGRFLSLSLRESEHEKTDFSFSFFDSLARFLVFHFRSSIFVFDFVFSFDHGNDFCIQICIFWVPNFCFHPLRERFLFGTIFLADFCIQICIFWVPDFRLEKFSLPIF